MRRHEGVRDGQAAASAGPLQLNRHAKILTQNTLRLLGQDRSAATYRRASTAWNHKTSNRLAHRHTGADCLAVDWSFQAGWLQMRANLSDGTRRLPVIEGDIFFEHRSIRCGEFQGHAVSLAIAT